MKAQFNQSLFSSLALAASISAIAVATPANASSLINGWNYTRDDYSYDGSDFSGTGQNSRFDIYGVGIKEVGNEIWVAINASTPRNGVPVAGALGGNVGWGDLLFDFGKTPGHTFKDTNDSSSFLGVHFSTANASNAPSLGVYSGVSGKSVATQKYGYGSFDYYGNSIKNESGANPVIGDLGWGGTIGEPPAYYAPYRYSAAPTLISSYSQQLSGIRTLDSNDLAGQGFTMTSNLPTNNPNTFAFAFVRPQGFQGDYVASLFLECINDSIAIKGTAKPVPVPGLALGAIFAGACGLGQVLRKRRQSTAVA